jgi:hypothetical protein
MAARLRSRLAEYYMGSGAHDPLVFVAPKGSYQISCHHRKEPAVGDVGEAADQAQPAEQSAAKWPLISLSFLAAFGLAAVIFLSARRSAPTPAPASNVPANLASLWQPFLKSQQEPLVVFANHRFFGTGATGLRPFRQGVDPVDQLNDTYSGTGTVVAVHEITKLFARFGRSVSLKRGELLTWDEAQNANLIFVGAPAANLGLRELSPLTHFRFGDGDGAIENLEQAAGEEKSYFRSSFPYTSDYAVVAFVPGFRPERRIALLAGTTTYGTQAAAEFACREDQVAALLAKLGKSHPEQFEALLHVRITRGVPTKAELKLTK